VVTWTSIFPLDVVKTRLQTQDTNLTINEQQSLLARGGSSGPTASGRMGAFEVARHAYRQEGLAVFFRGLGVCSVRAFIVNAVQVRSRTSTLMVEALIICSGLCMNGS